MCDIDLTVPPLSLPFIQYPSEPCRLAWSRAEGLTVSQQDGQVHILPVYFVWCKYHQTIAFPQT